MGNILVSHYERILDWADKHASGKNDKNCYVYGLVCDKEDGHACAILEIAHARPGSDDPWLKVLSVYLEPRLDIGEMDVRNTDDIATIGEIMAHALTKSLGLTLKEHPSSKLKVYARTDLELNVFQFVAAEAAKDDLGGMVISIHGRWLEFSIPKLTKR